MTSKETAAASRRAVRQAHIFASRAPAAARLPPHALIRTLRTALHMTQAQLAERSGLPQSHLARVESGAIDPRLGTLRKILGALSCDVLMVPRMRRGLDDVLEDGIRRKARENVARAADAAAPGSRPSGGETARAVRAEESRLRTRPSSEIWAG